MRDKITTDEFPASEAVERFKNALRGARVAGHKPMESLLKKKAKKAKKKKTK